MLFKHPIKKSQFFPNWYPVTSHQYPVAMRVSQFLGIESADPLRLRSGVAGESVSVEDNATACQARCFRTGCFKGVLLFPICLSLLDHVWVPIFCFFFFNGCTNTFLYHFRTHLVVRYWSSSKRWHFLLEWGELVGLDPHGFWNMLWSVLNTKPDLCTYSILIWL